MNFFKVTVIGGAGFIGTNLCQKLSDKKIPFEIIDIQISHRFPDKCKFGDVRDFTSLEKNITGDVVVNLAAVHSDNVRNYLDYHHTNVDGAINISKVCRKKNIKKIVFTSSVAVYGFADEGADESAPIKPYNEYGKTKYLAEEIFKEWQKKDENSLIIIRPTVVFGEGNRGNVFNLLKQIASRRFVMVGNGKNKKSMTYVGNIVAFIEQTIISQRDCAVYNYIDAPDMDMNTLVKQVRQTLTGRKGIGPSVPLWLGMIIGYIADGIALVTGNKLAISSLRIKKFCATTSFKSAKAELDGFKAPFNLQQGLNRTLESEFINPDPDREVFYTE